MSHGFVCSFEEYCAGICNNNYFWVINNAQLVLHSLYTLNSTLDGRRLDTFYSVYEYTSSISLLIEEAFRVRGALYLSV